MGTPDLRVSLQGTASIVRMLLASVLPQTSTSLCSANAAPFSVATDVAPPGISRVAVLPARIASSSTAFSDAVRAALDAAGGTLPFTALNEIGAPGVRPAGKLAHIFREVPGITLHSRGGVQFASLSHDGSPARAWTPAAIAAAPAVVASSPASGAVTDPHLAGFLRLQHMRVTRICLILYCHPGYLLA